MKLPNLSYMMKVGQLRYIQSMYERGEYRNPDLAVRDFLSTVQRWACDLRGKALLDKLRAQPFYYYVVARTKYYDAVFVDGIAVARHIVNIGCGSDTRAYRLAHILKQKEVKVLECDQAEAINTKRQLVSGLWPTDHVDYMAIDLNEPSWPEFGSWLRKRQDSTTLVMLEGVSPYVNADAFGRFLDFLASNLKSGSHLAYDFKLHEVAQGFGISTRTQHPFRLSDSRDECAAYHRTHGLSLEHFELSADLTMRLIPGLSSSAPLFREDALVRLSLP